MSVSILTSPARQSARRLRGSSLAHMPYAERLAAAAEMYIGAADMSAYTKAGLSRLFRVSEADVLRAVRVAVSRARMRELGKSRAPEAAA
jgi:hypothetical protein